MKLIAHKGKLSREDIGNCRSSFLKALSKPYISGIECDVRLTKDNKIAVIHDPVIDFVSNGSGIVKQMTLEELKQYDILSLEELLCDIHSEKMILIELKGEENDKTIVDIVNSIIENYRHLNIVIISFWYSLLKYFKEINPNVKLGLLIGYFLNQNHIYNHFHYNLFSYHYLDDIDMNKKLMYFTINKRKEALEIKKKRDDIYLITDNGTSFKDLV